MRALICLIVFFTGIVLSASGQGASAFKTEHQCSTSATSAVCLNQISIRTFDLTEPSDFYVVPHRGYWGAPDVRDVPENSDPAITKASEALFGAVELDVLKVEDDFILSHDFIFPRLTTGNFEDYMWDHEVSDIVPLYLKDRPGQPTTEHVTTLSDALVLSAALGLVLMIDTRPIKAHYVDGVCVANCAYEDGSVVYDTAYMSNIRDIIDQAIATNQEAGLVFKVPFPVDYVKTQVGTARFNKVLWMPQANPTKLQWYFVNHLGYDDDYVVTIQDLISFVDDWAAEIDSVSAFETTYSKSSDIRLGSFTHDGVSYANLLEYILKVAERRPGTFSGEPVGAAGLVNEYGDWRMAPDPRADHLNIIDYEYANYMVITTDRPDVWRSISEAY